MTDSVSSLTQRLDDIHARYRRSFANRSRATRDLGLMDSLIGELTTLSGSLSGVQGAPAALGKRVEDLRSLLGTERDAIANVQARGPDAVAVARLADWSDVDFHRYLRLFGGQNRTTRDLELLRELLAAETARRDALRALPGAAQTDDGAALLTRLDANIELYQKEVAAIPAARAGLDAREYARVLASLANTQFGLYRLHFAEKPRRSRRVALLERILRSLDATHRAMLAVRDLGVNNQTHLDNLAKVAERIEHHRGEVAQIQAARAGASTAELAGALGDDANAVFKSYREGFAGKPRESRDLAKLGEHVERLHEIARAMDELDRERGDATNKRNLGIVVDALRVYEREYRSVKEARGAKA